MKLKRYAEMEQKLAEQEQQLQNQEAMQVQMDHFYQRGLIREDINGGWIAVESPEEQQQILAQR